MSEPTIEFRAFKSGDLETLQNIRQLAFEPIFRSFRETVGPEIASIVFTNADEEQAKLLEKLSQANATQKMFVAELDEQIVGFVAVIFEIENKVGEISLNAVHPDFADRGLGTKLYKFALVLMKENGMKVATVGVGGDLAHTPARRAYEKAGFQSSIPSLWMYRLLN
ncbi:MAG: GNAT family N-acetyltransferase [Methyloligellaceae bacterium]